VSEIRTWLPGEVEVWVGGHRFEEPAGPWIPLAGRGGEHEKLREAWSRVLQGSACFTLVTGEPGVGKTRLLRSFLAASAPAPRTRVLEGRCYELAPLLPYQPVLEVLRGAAVAGEAAADLVRLISPDVPVPAPPLPEGEGRRRLFASVARFFEGLCREGGPLVLFLDDVHFADRDTLDLLMSLTARLQGPVWILAACRPDELDPDHPLEQMVRYGEGKGRASRLEVGRLERAALEEIAGAVVGAAQMSQISQMSQMSELAGFLEERSEGLPLAAAEIVNHLWDEGILVSPEEGRWSLSRPLRDLDLPEDLDELIRRRIRRLPNSTKRMATLAAILGQSFDAGLLQEAADEHLAVVDIGLEILLKRWLIRPSSPSLNPARRGSFEFSHERIRSAVYRELNPLRRQAMHAQVAESLERLRGGRDAEALAFHYAAAGQWERALPHLEQAIERALSVQAMDAARRYCDQAIEGLSRLAAAARGETQAARWRDERERIREIRERAVV
jgi:predicted ATPase